MKLPDRIIINEVSLRDGLQNEPRVVPTGDKVELAGDLAGCGITRIELSSFVNPKLVPQMADAEDLWGRVKRREGVRYSALVLNERGLDRAIKAGVPFVGIYVSASEAHSRRNSNMSIAEAKTEAVKLLKKAKAAGLIVRAGVMNAFGCAYEGRVDVSRVLDIIGSFLPEGIDELCLADSSGLGNPLQVRDRIRRAREISGNVDISLHLHNTRGLGLANLFAALEEGIAIFDTSLGGLGGCPFIKGAKGNIATEDTVYMLSEMGLETGISLPELIRAANDFEKKMGREFSSFVSRLGECG
ncbi:MAG: hydroxymethylglutaryl-CoA lyase [Syntrophaceae bacterium]